MVDQSELAWRELSRKYGADLCYTPMLNSGVVLRVMGNNKKLDISHFMPTDEYDRPIITQFCGNDPDTLLAAAKLVEDQCDAVDINFGCPQGIAKKGRYGAYLMDDWDIVSKLIKSLHEGLKVPVTAKIRVFENDREKTIKYAQMIERSGAQLLTVHGRSIRQKGQLTGLADWEMIKAVKEAVSIPVFANGNILYDEDVDECIKQTGVDGVMSAEGNLTDPTIFTREQHRVWKVTEDYIAIAKKHNTPLGYVRAHLFRMWHACIPHNIDLRNRLGGDSKSWEALDPIVAEMKQRLIAAEEAAVADGTAAAAPRTHHAASGDRVAPPYWICQPKVRDLDKDKRIVAQVTASNEALNAERKVRKAKRKAEREAAQRAKVPADRGNSGSERLTSGAGASHTTTAAACDAPETTEPVSTEDGHADKRIKSLSDAN